MRRPFSWRCRLLRRFGRWRSRVRWHEGLVGFGGSGAIFSGILAREEAHGVRKVGSGGRFGGGAIFSGISAGGDAFDDSKLGLGGRFGGGAIFSGISAGGDAFDGRKDGFGGAADFSGISAGGDTFYVRKVGTGGRFGGGGVNFCGATGSEQPVEWMTGEFSVSVTYKAGDAESDGGDGGCTQGSFGLLGKMVGLRQPIEWMTGKAGVPVTCEAEGVSKDGGDGDGGTTCARGRQRWGMHGINFMVVVASFPCNQRGMRNKLRHRVHPEAASMSALGV